MSTVGGSVLTLADWAKRQTPDNKVAKIVEMLAQMNPILEDIPFMEGNLVTGHRTVVRTGLPAVAWRLINQGVASTKSTTAQIDEACGMLEAWSETDEALAELAGNLSEFLLSESKAFLESMAQELASTVFYGNSGLNPEEITGLSPRYATISGATNAQNIVDGGGTGSDNSSIWLAVWGENTVHGIYPKGSQAGLKHNYLGKQVIENTGGVSGAKSMAYRTQFKWNTGIALRDWRYAVRVCNIDISNLVANSSAADLTRLMIQATHRIPNLGAGKPVFYMNRSLFQHLDLQRRDDVVSGGGITYENVDGKLVPSFRKIPIRVCDALLETEARVV